MLTKSSRKSLKIVGTASPILLICYSWRQKIGLKRKVATALRMNCLNGGQIATIATMTTIATIRLIISGGVKGEY
jgi:hypothetical protein